MKEALKKSRFLLELNAERMSGCYCFCPAFFKYSAVQPIQPNLRTKYHFLLICP
ncbi:hypothetical protein LRU_00849 [Ligilactobacillus ruminis SPM0211]|uniref:Uncharacterized protein n=1 Tax=Ligilactobacillus ruminis SPM0211 TaxID=1040964 RepID=F7QZJ3_9LACO|nr:hypothetical protein LRU_00849 [Ligilactobacillus ruminis SPM0211]